MERKLLLQRDPEDLRDYPFKSSGIKTLSALPRSVDLRPDRVLPVKDQYWLGACSFNAIYAACEFELNKHVSPWDVPLSRLHGYWHYRDCYDDINKDSGAHLRGALKTVYNYGAAKEADWPYIPERFRDKPSDRAEAAAYALRITEYNRLLNQDAIKVALSERHPVIFGMTIYRSFGDMDDRAFIPMPEPSREPIDDAHAMLFMGYDDDMVHPTQGPGCYIVQNSWSEKWGDGGHCYIPYNMVYYPFTFDYWMVKYATKERGSDFDSSILEGR